MNNVTQRTSEEIEETPYQGKRPSKNTPSKNPSATLTGYRIVNVSKIKETSKFHNPVETLVQKHSGSPEASLPTADR